MNSSLSIDNNYIYENLTESTNPKGIVHICHGMAEHIRRYKWLIDKLNNDGFHVISIDHRGHGNRIDNNLKGFFDDNDGWNLVAEDLIGLLDKSNKKFPGLNQYVLSHSMGSWIALAAMQKGMSADGLIISGSSKPSKTILVIQKFLVKIQIFLFGKKSVSLFLDNITLGPYNNAFKPNRTLKDWISSDNDNVDDYISDPLCGFPVTNGLWNDLAMGLLEVFDKNKYPKSNNLTPIFIISGSEDPVGENGKGVMRLYDFLSKIYSNTDVEIVNNARHEVFSETSKENSYNNLIKFIDSK
jgi:alpha-beta hydrolase superfamily lysophospholipase